MAHRILIAQLKQETSSFNPCLTRYDDFHQLQGDALLESFRGTRTEISGALDTFAASTEEVVPLGGLGAWAVSGGPICETDLDRLIDEFLAALEEHTDIDGALLCLHGAMAGEQEGDPEGRLLGEVRRRLPEIPLVVTLDLHAIFTMAMELNSHVVVPFHTYPHIDQYETGKRGAAVLLRLLAGTVHLNTSCVALPMLVRGDELITATGLFGEAIRACQDIEATDDGISAGVFIGNAFTDVPGLKSWVMVCSEDARESEARAREIADFMWQHREDFQAKLESLDEAIRIANATDGLTVFSDAADATASGASGDSNAILAGLLGRHPEDSTVFDGRGLLSIVDAPAAHQANAAGEGATIQVALGGTRDPGRFQPLDVTAEVVSLWDGHFTYESGTKETAGVTAVLRVQNVDILVTERSVYVVGRNVYTAHGLEPTEYDVVVAKSPNGFRTHYESIAANIVAVDVPGSTSANLHSLPFQRVSRPIFPLDADASYAFSD